MIPSSPPRVRPSAMVLLFLAVFLVGVVVGRAPLRDAPPAPEPAPTGELPAPIDPALIREVWDLLHEEYVGDVNDEQLADGILHGLVGGLRDPYSVFADPEETGQFADDISGSFTGIGVEIGVRRGLVTVIAPLRGSPAERAGLRARDILISIDGEEVTTEFSLTEVVGKIRGPAGTTVELGILREGDDGSKTIKVLRERIRVESVKVRQERGVGIIELTAFNEDTARRFREAARELLGSKVSGIVLDLRNNPGGILQGAVDIAGHFVPEGELVVREVPANPDEAVEYRAAGPGDLRDVPLVVLVNEGSASASEILAGALRDLRHVKLVGTPTFGKGTVQKLIDLSNGASLHITIAKWFTPAGTEITERGLAPDVTVEDPDLDDAQDVVLQRAFEVVRAPGT